MFLFEIFSFKFQGWNKYNDGEEIRSWKKNWGEKFSKFDKIQKYKNTKIQKYENTKIQKYRQKSFKLFLFSKSIFRLIIVSVIVAPSTVYLYQLLEYRNFLYKTPLLIFFDEECGGRCISSEPQITSKIKLSTVRLFVIYQNRAIFRPALFWCPIGTCMESSGFTRTFKYKNE